MKAAKSKQQDGAAKVKTKSRQSARFRQFEIKNHTSDPEKTGHLPNELEYEFGTPNLSRNETILLVASNSSTHERLLVKLRWRPVLEADTQTKSAAPPSSSLATLIGELELTTHSGQVYEFKQIETYKPEAVCLNKAKLKGAKIISQYGSNASRLKLVIANPYRRMRLVFSGHMTRVSGASNEDGGDKVFVKLGCSITPVGQIFDFLDDIKRTGDNKINPFEPDYNDRHEQRVRLCGECSIFPSDGVSPPDKQLISLRGFHVRHLSVLAASDVSCTARRLYAYLLNGKSFHLGILRQTTTGEEAESQLAQVGYTNFSLLPHCDAMKRLGRQELLKLDQILASLATKSADGELASIEVQNVQGDEALTCTIKEVLGSGWLKVEATTRFVGADASRSLQKLKPSPGWAWVSQDDQLSASPEEMKAISESVSELRRAMQEGSIVMDAVVDNAGGEQPALVVSIEEKCCTSSQLVGSKASSLAQLHCFQSIQAHQGSAPALSYQVPYALVLTRHAYDMILDENINLDRELDKVRQLLIDEGTQEANVGSESGGNVAQSSKVRDKCKQLEDLVKQFRLPKPIGDQLLERLAAHYSERTRFAVRSSSWGEDEGDMSAAGQLTTILGVEFNRETGDLGPLSRAIMECFASKFSVENVHYKRQHGLPLDLPMAVVVQEMVECDRAGVMFTCDPVTGDSGWLTITANYGLGESVVSAQADPDSIRVRRFDVIEQTITTSDSSTHCSSYKCEIQKKIGRKEFVVARSGGAAESEQQYDRSKCCLSDEQILQLARVGSSLEKYYSSKQRHCDIEFGYLNEQLFLFQCRPVTGLDAMSQEELIRECDRAPQTELVFCTRANVGEVAPHALRPLSLTYSLYHWIVYLFQMQLEFQPISGPDHLDASLVYCPQVLPQDLIYEKYHAFLALFGGSLLNLGEQNKTVITRSTEIGMFGRELEPQEDLIESRKCFKSPPNAYAGLVFQLKSLKFRMNPLGESNKLKQSIEKIYTSLLDEEKQQRRQGKSLTLTTDSRKLLEYYDRMKSSLELLVPTMMNHEFSFILDSEVHLSMNELLANYIDDPKKLCTAVNKFLGAVKNDVISAQIPERIRQIAELIKQNGTGTGSDSTCGSSPLTVDKFLAMSAREALEYLSSNSDDSSKQDAELRRNFGEFFQNFGHRCYGEFDIAFKTWREQPEHIIELIKTNCKTLSVEQTNGCSNSNKEKPTDTAPNGESNEGRARAAPAAGQSAGCKQASGSGNNHKLAFKEVLDQLRPDMIKPLSLVDKLKLKYLLVPRCQLLLAARESTKNVLIMYMGCQRLLARMLAREMHWQMRLPDEDLLYYLTFDEVEPLCRAHSPAIVAQAQRRRQLFRRLFPTDQVWKFDEVIRSRDLVPHHMRASELDEASKSAPRLHGTPASPGKVRGKICLVRNYKELNRVEPGSILLTHSTDIAFSPVFPLITGIITEVGGLVSHGAVVAREYGLPSVIGIENVTQILQDGEEILLDADSGTILRLTPMEGAANGVPPTPPVDKGSQESGTQTQTAVQIA